MKNANFDEVDDKGLPTSWAIPYELKTQWAKVVDDDGHSGKQCLRFLYSLNRYSPPVVQAFSCKPNTEYILSGWFKSDGKLRPVIAVAEPTTAGKPLRQVIGTKVEKWMAGRVQFNSGKNNRLTIALYADPVVLETQKAKPGKCWIDDVQVREADGKGTATGVTARSSDAPDVNIALNKPYTLGKTPNYGYSKDEGDKVQLTDGEYSVGYFWVQKSTVGWSNTSPVVITIDLQKRQPIRGISYRTAAGTAGVGYPNGIYIMVSDDGKNFFYIDELTILSSANGLPNPKVYGTHRFFTRELMTSGRYVRLAIRPAGSYTFVDEIEVYQGENEWLKSPRTEPVEDFDGLLASLATDTGIRSRLRLDIEDIRAILNDSKLSGAEKQKASRELDGFVKQVSAMPRNKAPDFRAVVPFNDLHRRILTINARILRSMDTPEFHVWHRNRWDMLEPHASPQFSGKPLALSVHMMDNEYRAEVFCMTNATDSPVSVHMRIDGLPNGSNPSWVAVHEVEFVDTQEKVVIADALPLARRVEGGFKTTIPAGMTRQIWMSFHPQGIKAGTHQGNVTLKTSHGKQIQIPLSVTIYPHRFPDQPTLSLGVWDYAAENGYDLTPENRDAAIANMKAHFVDSPWATPNTYPKLLGGVDAKGNITRQPFFQKFDKWVKEWEGARNFLVFMNVGESFEKKPMGSPAFDRAVSQWAKAWADHNRKIGLKPRQLGLLLVDEPDGEVYDKKIVAWAKAIKAGTNEINIFENPVHHAPWKASIQEAFEITDILCPNVPRYYHGGQKSASFYADLRTKGKQLWFYQCSGPARLHDPYYYHRLQQWHCWIHGAVGTGFWSYSDGAGASPWNDYHANRTSYTPVYLAQDSVTDGKHWEAVREGIEDYEYLRILKDRILELKEKGIRSPEISHGEKLLKELPKQVAGHFAAGQIRWLVEKDRSPADDARIKILKVLKELADL